MNSRVRWLAVLGVAAYLAACTYSDYDDRSSLKPEKDRKTAPNFKLTDSSGSPFQLADFQGKVVLLNFWATWCGPCKEEIPWLIRFQQEYKDRKFEVVGVSMDERGWDAVRPYIQRRKINYRVVVGTDELSLLYGGVQALPTTFLIDREGRVARVHVGLPAQSTYRREILDLLGSPQNEPKQQSGLLAAGFEILAQNGARRESVSEEFDGAGRALCARRLLAFVRPE